MQSQIVRPGAGAGCDAGIDIKPDHRRSTFEQSVHASFAYPRGRAGDQRDFAAENRRPACPA